MWVKNKLIKKKCPAKTELFVISIVNGNEMQLEENYLNGFITIPLTN